MRQARREMHYATLASDEALCGVNIARGGWTERPKGVTCHTCLARLANKRIEDLKTRPRYPGEEYSVTALDEKR